MFDSSDYTYDYEESIDDHLLYDQLIENQSNSEVLSPPPQIADDDNSIAFSTSINQSRKFISESLGIPASTLYHSDVSGLIVLRLKDFTLIRNDSRHRRIVPHLLVLPDDSFPQNHPDFFAALNTLQ